MLGADNHKVEELNPEGGLVLAPNALLETTESTQKHTVDRLHGLDSVVFAQGMYCTYSHSILYI